MTKLEKYNQMMDYYQSKIEEWVNFIDCLECQNCQNPFEEHLINNYGGDHIMIEDYETYYKRYRKATETWYDEVDQARRPCPDETAKAVMNVLNVIIVRNL